MANAPVGHTCPDINKLQKRLDNIVSELKGYALMFPEYKSDINSLASDVYDVSGDLEGLRSDNESLRTWGYVESKRADNAENRVEELEIEIESFKNEYEKTKN